MVNASHESFDVSLFAMIWLRDESTSQKDGRVTLSSDT